MPIDLQGIGEPRQRWLELGGQFRGVEVMIKESTPRGAERFRQRLARAGILRAGKNEGWQINSGREDDFFRSYAEEYISDWRGEITPKDAPYNTVQMGALLGASNSLFEQISNTITEDASFFVSSNGG